MTRYAAAQLFGLLEVHQSALSERARQSHKFIHLQSVLTLLSVNWLTENAGHLAGSCTGAPTAEAKLRATEGGVGANDTEGGGPTGSQSCVQPSGIGAGFLRHTFWRLQRLPMASTWRCRPTLLLALTPETEQFAHVAATHSALLLHAFATRLSCLQHMATAGTLNSSDWEDVDRSQIRCSPDDDDIGSCGGTTAAKGGAAASSAAQLEGGFPSSPKLGDGPAVMVVASSPGLSSEFPFAVS